jgi:hypothetical protein
MKRYFYPRSCGGAPGTLLMAAVLLLAAALMPASAEDKDRSEDRGHSGSQVTLPTHLGVPASKLITLICSGFVPLPNPNPPPGGTFVYPGCTQFSQVGTDGVQASGPYSVPAGETLVVLDVDWEATFNTPGTIVFLNFGCTSGCAFIYGSHGIADFQGIVDEQDHLTAGMYLTYIPSVTLGNGTFLVNVSLHGYLTP